MYPVKPITRNKVQVFYASSKPLNDSSMKEFDFLSIESVHKKVANGHPIQTKYAIEIRIVNSMTWSNVHEVVNNDATQNNCVLYATTGTFINLKPPSGIGSLQFGQLGWLDSGVNCTIMPMCTWPLFPQQTQIAVSGNQGMGQYLQAFSIIERDVIACHGIHLA